MGTVNAGWALSWRPQRRALWQERVVMHPGAGHRRGTLETPSRGRANPPAQANARLRGTEQESRGLNSGPRPDGKGRRRIHAGRRRAPRRAGRAVGYSPRGPRAPRAGPSRRRRGCRAAVRGPGERGCGRAGPAPRPAYESAAGRAPRGGNYGKDAGEGRGPRTFAISRLAAHSWHSWDPQEFSSFGSPGGRADGTLQRCGTPGLGGRAGTGGKGSGRGLGRKSGNRKRRAGHPGGGYGPRRQPPGREQSGAKRVGSRGATCYPGLEAQPLGFPAEILWAQTSAPGKLPTVWSSEQ